MAFENVRKIASEPAYLGIWAIGTGMLLWLYIGPLTDQARYDAVSWMFAITFPILAGGFVAGQWYNLTELKTCPASATGSGILGTILSIITVACPLCASVLFGWIGFGAALPAALLGGPWLKLTGLVLLFFAFYCATSEK